MIECPAEANSDVGAALAFAEKYSGAIVVVDGHPVLLAPEGVRAESLRALIEDYAEFPDRAQGTATLSDERSFVAHVKRHADRGSLIFADDNAAAPRLVAVYDYHQVTTTGRSSGGVRHLAHRAIYAPRLSKEWLAWAAAGNMGFMKAEVFAQFVEDHITEIVANPTENPSLKALRDLIGGSWATPSDLMGLSRGLQLSVSEKVKSGTSLSTGEIQVQFEQQHTNGAGGALRVPSLFAIGIPVFVSGELYQIAVRLRYRVNQGEISWAIAPHRLDRCWQHAFDELLARIQNDTEINVLAGAPEPALGPQT